MEERPPESEFPGTSPGASYAPGDLALLEAAFASLAEGVTVHDATGRIVACNRAATTLFGLPADQLLGLSASLRSALDVRYKDGTPVTGENSRVTHVLSTGRPERDCLLQFQLPGAAARSWVRANFQPLVREGAPEPWGVVCSFVDASEGPGADARMREFSRQLRTLFADDSAIVYVKDPRRPLRVRQPTIGRAPRPAAHGDTASTRAG